MSIKATILFLFSYEILFLKPVCSNQEFVSREEIISVKAEMLVKLEKIYCSRLIDSQGLIFGVPSFERYDLSVSVAGISLE